MRFMRGKSKHTQLRRAADRSPYFSSAQKGALHLCFPDDASLRTALKANPKIPWDREGARPLCLSADEICLGEICTFATSLPMPVRKQVRASFVPSTEEPETFLCFVEVDNLEALQRGCSRSHEGHSHYRAATM